MLRLKRMRSYITSWMLRRKVLYVTECKQIKKAQVQKMITRNVRMFRWLSGHTMSGNIRNEVIYKKVRVVFIEDKMREARLKMVWARHEARLGGTSE